MCINPILKKYINKNPKALEFTSNLHTHYTNYNSNVLQ